MKVNPELVKVQGRELPVEEITLAKKFRPKPDNVDWSFATRDGLVNPAQLTRWALVYPRMDQLNVQNFLKELTMAGRSLRVRVDPPKEVLLDSNHVSKYHAGMRNIVQMAPRIVATVIPNDMNDHYAVVKKICYLDNAVASQVVTCSKVIGKPQKHRTFATKVLMQMVAKLGNDLWHVSIPMKNIMVIGFDTYHDTINKGKSWGAFVASLNNVQSRYFSDVSRHETATEMSDKMKPMFMAALNKYREVNGCLPARIFVYRDGVGDGQLQHVFDHEVKMMREALHDLDPKPKLTFTVVSKRINTKFFKSSGKQHFNPPSGTVVDDVVTLPERYDFFLISQSVRQGTVNPTSYNVIYDMNNLPPDRMQQFTYKLTHLYYNWCGTVRVPAVCQYAHKLAYLVGNTLHQRPNAGLNSVLFFL